MPGTLKRPSLARLRLASLRPSSESSFPVQTGFPTSLADLVVKNHGRLTKTRRKPQRPAAVLAPPPSTAPVADELSPPPPSPAPPLSPVAARRQDAPRPEKGGAVFRLRPELLAHGGAVALAVLAVWSEGTVAAFTVAALSLLWIESASRRRRRLPRSAETEALLLDSCGRSPVSPIREVEDEAPRCSCSDSDKGDELVAAGAGGCSDDPTTPKLKAKRSLRKLISKKLQKKRESKDPSCSLEEHPDAAAVDTADPALKTESSVPFSTEQTPSESSIEWSSSSSESVVEGRRPGVKFPLAALAPVILAGLSIGKLPATALAVLCIVFSSAVQRL